MFAYFNNVPELGRGMKYGNSPPIEPSPTEEQQRAARTLEEKIRVADAALARQAARLKAARAQWEHQLATAKPVWWRPEADLEAPAWKPSGTVPEVAGRFGKAHRFDGTSYLDGGASGRPVRH